MNSKQEEQIEQEHLSCEHMSKMIRAQTVVMKHLHEDNLALQQENAELREALPILKQMIYSMKTNAHTFSNENVEEISKEGRAAMTLIDGLLNKK